MWTEFACRVSMGRSRFQCVEMVCRHSRAFVWGAANLEHGHFEMPCLFHEHFA